MDNTLSNTVLPQSSKYPLTLGMESNHPYNPMKGKIYNVRVWNYALTDTDILNFKNNYPTGFENGLVVYFDFFDGTGTTLFDKTIYKNNGQIGGATWVPAN
ncbi:hypothetical protein D3C80_1800710 [compost metagenome]